MLSIESKQFLEQARRNEGLALHLYNNCSKKYFYNWIFVATFYSAFHYLCSFLSYKGYDIPDSHKYESEDFPGMNKVAREKFVTSFSGEFDSAGADYEQLFDWGYIARYEPLKSKKIFGINTAKTALVLLEAVKLITFNEVGHRAITKNNRFIIVPVNEQYISNLRHSRLNNA